MTEDVVPSPLGWCLKCLTGFQDVRAVTLWEGTALCRKHAVPTVLLAAAAPKD